MTPPPDRPDHDLALSYAQRGHAGAAALFALDRQLGSIVARATDPLVGQMRLTWWREAIEALDTAPPPAEPILRALADQVVGTAVTGAALASITDGWEALLEDPLTADAIARHAQRGAILFDALAAVIGAADPGVAQAGRGWALADLSQRLSDRDAAGIAADDARAALKDALGQRWSRPGRAIGALALGARSDLDGASPASRVGRLFWHRLTGR